VLSIEYDPNRTSFIALVTYRNGVCSYILAPHLLKPDDFILSGSIFHLHTLYHIGFSGKLNDIPIGTMIHSIELSPSRGGQLARSAGCYAMLMKKKVNGYCLIRLPSGERRLVPSLSIATVGCVSNLEHRDENLGKAGRSRWKGRRPKVRGVAMNPVDHPHGGATSGGRIPVTPWKKITKGQPTRRQPNRWVSNEL
jgi:large subunit ribosomal protein L2